MRIIEIKNDIFIEEYKHKILEQEKAWQERYTILTNELEVVCRSNVDMNKIDALKEKQQEAWEEMCNYSKMTYLFIDIKEDKVKKWCEQFDKNSTSITFDIKQFKNK